MSTVLAPSDVDWLTLASLLKSACVVAADIAPRDYTGDMFAFANAVALAAGGAAAIVGPSGEILGFSNLPGQPIDDLRLQTTLRLEELEAPANDPDYELVYAASGCIYFASQDPSMFDRVAAAVRSGGEILGSIWVLVPDPTLGPNAEKALTSLLDTAVRQLHHARLDVAVQRDGDAVLLKRLLSSEALAQASADALGISGLEWFRLALLVSETTSAALFRRQIQGVTHWLRIAHRNAVAAETDDGLVILFSGTSQESWSSTAQSLQRFFEASQATRSELSIATSFPMSDTRSLKAEFERLRILSRVAASGNQEGGGGPAFVRMEDHWASVELTHIAEVYSEPANDRLEILGQIERFDRAHNTEYWATLRVYALANRSYANAATRLHVHPNTVRYRIDRVAEMFGLDLRDVQTFAWVVIQCHQPK